MSLKLHNIRSAVRFGLGAVPDLLSADYAKPLDKNPRNKDTFQGTTGVWTISVINECATSAAASTVVSPGLS
jgi:hypothetical protein